MTASWGAELFARIVCSPDQEQKFPVGPASAKKLGYDPNALPPSVTESFWQQTARGRLPDDVDKIQPHQAPFDDNQADRPVDPATDLGAVVGQAAPQQGLLGVGSGAPNHVPQRQDELPRVRGQGVEERLHAGRH